MNIFKDRIFVIAEAGSNHDGDLDKARGLIGIAARAGADAVKFQLFKAKKLFMNPPSGLDSYEFNEKWLWELEDCARKNGIKFLVTPFDEESADLIDSYVEAYKIGSYELTHYPLLKHVAKKEKPVILSTGMATPKEVIDAVDTLDFAGCEEIVLMHCTSLYPTALEHANLSRIRSMAINFGRGHVTVPGYSDHTESLVTGAIAVEMGARVIEKHFTYDKLAAGPDHKFALNPHELAQYIKNIRDAIELINKQYEKSPEENERKCRRSLHLLVDVKKGDLIGPNMTAVLRPEGGLHPKVYGQLLIAKRNLKAGKPLKANDILKSVAIVAAKKGLGHMVRCENFCKGHDLEPVMKLDSIKKIDQIDPLVRHVLIDINYPVPTSDVKKLQSKGHKVLLIDQDGPASRMRDVENFTTEDCLNPSLYKPLKKFPKKTILILTGGLDQSNHTEEICDALKNVKADLKVVVGPQYEGKFQLRNNMTVLKGLDNDAISELLRRSHHGIVLYGVSAKEALAAKLPIISFSDQEKNHNDAQALKAEGFHYIGLFPSKNKIRAAVKKHFGV